MCSRLTSAGLRWAKVTDAAVEKAAQGVGAAGCVWVVDQFFMSGRVSDFAQRLLAYAGG